MVDACKSTLPAMIMAAWIEEVSLDVGQDSYRSNDGPSCTRGGDFGFACLEVELTFLYFFGLICRDQMPHNPFSHSSGGMYPCGRHQDSTKCSLIDVFCGCRVSVAVEKRRLKR